MKAYHVYMARNSIDRADVIAERPLEIITHMYSCITHKQCNPDVPLCLIADPRTVDFFDQWKITDLYDDVDTDILDDYPADRVSPNFWASPKIWAMSKLSAPFVIQDTDLVLQKPLADFADCDVLYLHRELSGLYPNIFDVSGPPGFVWDEDITRSFLNSQPMNCAVVGMFNEDFKSDYVRTYFDFVLDSTGEMQYANGNSSRMYLTSPAQVMVEQWLLAALAEYWTRIRGTPIRTRAVCRVVYGWDYFQPYDLDLGPDTIASDMANTFYHLWGAKGHQNDRQSTYFLEARSILLGGRRIVDNSAYADLLREPFDAVMAAIQ